MTTLLFAVWYILAFLMLMLGVGLCIAREVKLPGKRKVARKAAYFAAFFLFIPLPLIIALHPWIEDLDNVYRQIINGSLTMLCIGACLWVLRRWSTVPQRKPRAALQAAPEPLFAEEPAPEPAPRPVTRTRPTRNPFDFS